MFNTVVSTVCVIILLLLIVFLGFLAIREYFSYTKKPSFVVVEKTLNYKLYVHLVTRLTYIVFGNTKSFTLVVNDDGTPYKYTGDLSSFKK